MSKTPITTELVEPDSPLAGMVLAEGEDRITVGSVYDPETETLILKSLRLPRADYEAVVAVKHPGGFSGVVREAISEWLERHTGTTAEVDDARHAIAVLQRVVARFEGGEPHAA